MDLLTCQLLSGSTPALLFYSNLRYSNVIHSFCLLNSITLNKCMHSGDTIKLPQLPQYFILFFYISEALDSHQRLALWPTLGAPPPQWMYLIPIHYSRLAPIHIQQSVVNWAASLYNCRDVPSQPNEKKYSESKAKLPRTVKQWNVPLLHEIQMNRIWRILLCVWPWNTVFSLFKAV